MVSIFNPWSIGIWWALIPNREKIILNYYRSKIFALYNLLWLHSVYVSKLVLIRRHAADLAVANFPIPNVEVQ